MKKNIILITKKAAFAIVFMAAVSASLPAVTAQAAVKLNKKSVTLYTKKTVTLKLTGTAKTVKWTSSKPAVASVNQKGKVTAKKAGRVNIKAKIGKKTFTCKITVKNPYLNTKAASLEAGQTLKLKLTGAAAETFESSSTAASVDAQGAVTANSEGTAVITITDTKGRTYTCTITVTARQKDETDAAESNSADTNNSTGSASDSTETQSPAAAEHEHTWEKHYSYDGNGKPVANAYFCTDVTCADNQGYGTDNGWRGEKYTPWYDSRDNAVSTQPSQNTAVNTPVNSDTVDSINNNSQTGITGNTGSNAGDIQTEQPAEQTTAEHSHDYTIPVMSADNLRVEGYACECGEKASHNHEWTEAVYRTEGYGAGTVIEYYKCPCGETMTSEGYGKLVEANKKASNAIRDAWIVQNITAGMTDAEKVKAVIREMKTWKYESLPHASYVMANIERKGVCINGNNAFKDYCAAMGIRAEIVDMEPYGIQDHIAAYVWIDGIQYFVDATPGIQGIMGSQDEIWTMEGFELLCDYNAGRITGEEFDERIESCIR